MSFDNELATQLAAVDLSSQGTPTTLNRWLGAQFVLGVVSPPEGASRAWSVARATYVSDKANVRPRLNQFTSTRPTVAVAVLGQDAEDGTREDLVDYATARVVGPGRPAHAFTIVSEAAPSVIDVVGDPESAVVGRIRALSPNAILHAIAGPVTADPIRGPVLSLPVIPLVVNPRLERMLRLAIATSPAVMLVGPPGTGKSTLVDHVLQRVIDNPKHYGLAHAPSGVRRVTAEESWTFHDLVGGQTVVEGDLVFRPGHLLRALAEDEWLILDEANRADLDKIFGGVLTWLADQEVQLTTATTASGSGVVTLGWDRGARRASGPTEEQLNDGVGDLRYVAHRDWRIIGTYNATDAHRVFRLGQALGRRFLRVPVPPITSAQFRQALASWTSDLPDRVSEVLVGLYAVHLSTEFPLGPAVFLRAASYIVNGLNLEHGFPASGGTLPQAPPPSAIDELIVEAYLLGVGTILAQQPPDEVDRIRQEIISRGFFSVEQWDFVAEMLTSLA